LTALMHHVSIFVQDMKRALQLFNGILGMPIIQQMEGVHGGGISTLLGIPDFRGDMAFLKHPNQKICLELVRQNGGLQDGDSGISGFGICLAVPDLDAVHVALTREGWIPLSKPLEMMDPSGRAMRVFCFRTDEGLMVELIQQ
jgi:catechol 2,3-dioxygenase-like lactoylglutathione lyase family enzyme